MRMADWAAKLDAFLQFNDRNILEHSGTVSRQLAEEHARREFARYDAQRLRLAAAQPTSDFDKAVEAVKRLEQPPAPPGPSQPARKKRGRRE
jgi:hypothetical protein